VIDTDGTGLRKLTSDWDMTPAWSPDGRRIAFARRANLGGSGPGGVNTYPADSFSLYVIDSDGQNLRRLTSASTTVDYAPSWSSDGRHIAFTRDPDGAQDAYATFEFATGTRGGPLSAIYVIGADGSELREVTEETNGDVQPDWYGPN
jgi:Tol biopolymer transport system component